MIQKYKRALMKLQSYYKYKWQFFGRKHECLMDIIKESTFYDLSPPKMLILQGK